MQRNLICLTHGDGSNSRGMPEQQGDWSELSRNPSTDKPRQQRGTNMDRKLQEIMHMLYILMPELQYQTGGCD